MKAVLNFLKKHRLTVGLIAATMAIGYIGHLFAQLLIIAISIYLLFTKRFEEFLYYFLFVLIASDNYFLHYAQEAKPIMILLLIAGMIFYRKILYQKSILPYFSLFFVLLFILMAVAEYQAIGFQKGLSYFLLFAAITPLIISIYKEQDEETFKKLLEIQLILGALNLLYILIEPEYVSSHGGRFRGIFGNPNGLAMYCYFAIVMFWILRSHFKLNMSRSFEVVFMILFFGLLLLSGSRASFISVIIFLVLSRFKRNEFFAGTVITTIALFFSEEIVSLLQNFIVFLGFEEQFRITGNEAQSISTGSGRLVAWRFAWQKIETAFFFGRGWAFEETWFHLPTVQASLNQLNHQGGAHNVFVIFWLNTGIVGLLLFMLGLFRVIYKASQNNKLAIPLVFSALFLCNFEPWLAASLNPYTIQFLLVLSVMLFIPKHKNEEVTELSST